MLDIATPSGWKFGGAWMEKLCPENRSTTIEPKTVTTETTTIEPTTVTTTTEEPWTWGPTTLPTVCEPTLTQVEILIAVLRFTYRFLK